MCRQIYVALVGLIYSNQDLSRKKEEAIRSSDKLCCSSQCAFGEDSTKNAVLSIGMGELVLLENKLISC